MALPTSLANVVQRMHAVTQELRDVKDAGPFGANRAANLAQVKTALDALRELEAELNRVGRLYS